MKAKQMWYRIVLAACLIWIKLFVGVYQHEEYLSQHYFIKHRASWQWYFYSPIGYTNTYFENLTQEDQLEELIFDEFVRKQGHSR